MWYDTSVRDAATVQCIKRAVCLVSAPKQLIATEKTPPTSGHGSPHQQLPPLGTPGNPVSMGPPSTAASPVRGGAIRSPGLRATTSMSSPARGQGGRGMGSPGQTQKLHPASPPMRQTVSAMDMRDSQQVNRAPDGLTQRLLPHTQHISTVLPLWRLPISRLRPSLCQP